LEILAHGSLVPVLDEVVAADRIRELSGIDLLNEVVDLRSFRRYGVVHAKDSARGAAVRLVARYLEPGLGSQRDPGVRAQLEAWVSE
jgi:hypothetical protein